MSKFAVIIVDMQDFFLEKFNKDKKDLLINNQRIVLEFCVKKSIPIILLEYKKRGQTISKLLEIAKKSTYSEILTKESNGGFTNTNLDEILKENKINNIILMGINASGCVQDTAIGALNRGYRIITAGDIIASNTKKDEYLAISKRWYSKNGLFFESVDKLLEYIK